MMISQNKGKDKEKFTRVLGEMIVNYAKGNSSEILSKRRNSKLCKHLNFTIELSCKFLNFTKVNLLSPIHFDFLKNLCADAGWFRVRGLTEDKSTKLEKYLWGDKFGRRVLMEMPAKPKERAKMNHRRGDEGTLE